MSRRSGNASRGGRFTRATGALAVLLALVGGVPVALYAAAGYPLPRHLPALSEVTHALTTRDQSGRLLLHTLVLIAWLAWAAFTFSVLVEIPARLRGRPAPRIPGLRVPQRLAAGLITAVALASSGAPALAAPVHLVAPPPPAVVTVDTPRPVLAPQTVITIGVNRTAPGTAAPDAVPGTPAQAVPGVVTATGDLVYQVQRGDQLSAIAHRFLGSFDAYGQIAALNRDVIPDDSGPHGPDHIETHWRLRLPAGAYDRGPAAHATGTLIGAQPPTAGHTAGGAGSGSGTRTTPGTPATPGNGTPGGGTGSGSAGHDGGGGIGASMRDGGGHGIDPTAHALLAAAAGVAAAGVLSAHLLLWRRRREQEALEDGLDLELPPVTAPAVPRERDLDRLDLALRDLSNELAGWEPRDLPDIMGSWLAGGDLHLMLTRRCPAPPRPWVGAERTWTLPAHARLNSYFAGQHPPLPALITVGTQEGTHLLLDIERLGMVTISGDHRQATNLLRHIAAECAGGVWSRDLAITIAGFDTADTRALVTIGGGRVTAAENVPSAIERAGIWAREVRHRLAGLHLPDPLSARVGAHPADAALLAPHILLLADPTPADLSRLAHLDAELAQAVRSPLAVVATTMVPLGRWPITVERNGQATLDFLDTRIRSATLPAEALADLVQPAVSVRRMPQRPVEPAEVPVGRHRVGAMRPSTA